MNERYDMRERLPRTHVIQPGALSMYQIKWCGDHWEVYCQWSGGKGYLRTGYLQNEEIMPVVINDPQIIRAYLYSCYYKDRIMVC